MDQNTLFEIGSITKTFAGILLADFVLNSKYTLSTPVNSLLSKEFEPNLAFREDTIRLFHMMNHTSGLPNMPLNFDPKSNYNPFSNYSNKNLFKVFKLTKEVEVEYLYSNRATAIIAEPLNLFNSKVVLSDKAKINLAKGHNNGVEVRNLDFPSFEGAGGTKSNLKDMMQYLSHNMGFKKSKLSSAIKLSHVNTIRKINQKVGLGWHITERNNTKIMWHNGGTGGYHSFIGFSKEKKKGVVILTNSTTDNDYIGLHLLDDSYELK